MKKIFANLAIIMLVALIIILIFSFVTWDIQWIASNSFMPSVGRTFSLVMGALICAAVNDYKKNN